MTIDVRDAGLGIGADFYADVRVLDAFGQTVVEWKDPYGWDERAGPGRLRDSMRWTSSCELEFRSRHEAVKLTVP